MHGVDIVGGLSPISCKVFGGLEVPSDKPLVFTVLLVTLELMFQLSYEIWQFGVGAICLWTTWVYGNVNGFFQTKGRVGVLPMHPSDVWFSLLWRIVTHQPVRFFEGFSVTLGPQSMKNEGFFFSPQNMGEITPKNDGCGFRW